MLTDLSKITLIKICLKLNFNNCSQLEELVDLPTKSTDELEQLSDRLRCLDEDKVRYVSIFIFNDTGFINIGIYSV